MKLWIISQWGNKDDGGNGPDTNCIVRAPTLEKAASLAEDAFKWKDFPHSPYNDGKANNIHLMGDDGSNKEAKVIIPIWIAHAFNFGGYEGWGRNDNDQWEEYKKLFPKD